MIDMSGDNKKIRVRQEILYLVYLRNVLKYNKEQIFDEWLSIKNGTASFFISDKEQLTIEFSHLFAKSEKPIYNNHLLSTPLEPIKIFKSEINFLNSLDTPLWVKEYWFCLLFYYKFEVQNQKRVQLSTSLNNWCIKQCRSIKAKYYHNAPEEIVKSKKRLEKNIIDYHLKQSEEKYNSYTPSFLASDGEIKKIYYCLDDIKKAIKLVKDIKIKCSKCGKSFVKTSKTKTTLCPQCYIDHRRESKRKSYEKCKKQKICD